jgi:hypothetical protein
MMRKGIKEKRGHRAKKEDLLHYLCTKIICKSLAK